MKLKMTIKITEHDEIHAGKMNDWIQFWSEGTDYNMKIYIYIYIRYVRPHRHVPEKNEFAISPQGLRLKFPIFDRGEQAVSRAGSLAPIF